MSKGSRSQAAELHAAISDLVRVYQFRDRDRICCHDISVTQCYALETLVHRGPMRLNALAAVLFLDKSTASRVVQTLIRKGYVKSGRDPLDARASTLVVSASGQKLHDKIVAGLVQQQEELLSDLSPELRRGVVDVIRRLANAADARFRAGVSTCCEPTTC